jgi:hypothetical protein
MRSAEKVDPIPVVPPTDVGDAKKSQDSRDVLVKEMAGIGRQVAEVQEELARVESRLDGASLTGPDREKWRKQRNLLRDRLEGLAEAQASGQKKLDRLDLLLLENTADVAMANRRGSQASGALIAEQMRHIIQDLAGLFQQFRALEEEDRVAADVIRSVAPHRLNEVTTFSWTTGTDGNFQQAIAQVISESVRTEKALEKRPKANGDTP